MKQKKAPKKTGDKEHTHPYVRIGLILMLILIVGSILASYLQPLIGGDNMNLNSSQYNTSYRIVNGSIQLGINGEWYDNYTVYKAGTQAMDQMGDNVLLFAKNTNTSTKIYLGYDSTQPMTNYTPQLNQLQSFDYTTLENTPGVRKSTPTNPPWLNNTTAKIVAR
jgi:hypothetical protein